MTEPAAHFHETDKGFAIRVRLTPGASRDEIGSVETSADGASHLAVKVRAAPERNLANKALIALFAKALRLPKSGVEIASGGKSRIKTVAIAVEADERRQVETKIRTLSE